MEILGWTGTTLILLGYYLNANKKASSWIVWFTGNTFMLLYSLNIMAWPQFALALVLMILNVYGWINWLEDGRR
jgi:hypothetical protein